MLYACNLCVCSNTFDSSDSCIWNRISARPRNACLASSGRANGEVCVCVCVCILAESTILQLITQASQPASQPAIRPLITQHLLCCTSAVVCTCHWHTWRGWGWGVIIIVKEIMIWSLFRHHSYFHNKVPIFLKFSQDIYNINQVTTLPDRQTFALLFIPVGQYIVSD